MCHHCCWDDPRFAPRPMRGWMRGYGPPPWAWHWGWPFAGPTKTERKEWLEAFKKHLEERLAEVNEELSKL